MGSFITIVRVIWIINLVYDRFYYNQILLWINLNKSTEWIEGQPPKIHSIIETPILRVK